MHSVKLVALERRLRTGDRTTLDLLLRSVQEPVYRYLVARLTSVRDGEDLAWDLTQEALLRIAAGIARCSFESDSRLLAWVLTVARSVLVDHARLEQRRNRRVCATPNLERVATLVAWSEWQREALTPSGAGDGLLLAAIRSAHGRLPAATAELLRLRLELGASWREIGAVLGTTAAGAKRRFQRVQASLRFRVLASLRALPPEQRRTAARHLRRLGMHEPLGDPPDSAGRKL